MSSTLLHRLRWLACLLMLNLIAMHAAMAAPPSKESLNKFFEVNNVPDLVKRATESVGAAKAKEWQEETDPAAKAEKKAQFEKIDAIIRKHITWKALEPIAVESYQRRLEEADVRELIAYAQSPSGQIRVKKLAPAVIATLPQLFSYLDKRVDEISDRKEGTPAPVKTIAKPAAGSKEALAATLIMEMPGSRDDYTQRMAGMEAAMLKAAEMFGAEEGDKMTTQLKRGAAKLQREITYEEIVGVQAKALADKLTEAEFNMLIAEHRKPALIALLGKQAVADREFAQGANKYMSEKVIPSLMGELLAALQPAASKPAPKKKPK